jgi:hypothetical protein
MKKGDVRMLTTLLSQFSNKSPSGIKRIHMTLFLWSQLSDERKGVPYFNCGIRTIAKECELSTKTARAFIEAMEQDGWIVRIGESKSGKYVRRTFGWLAGDDVTVPLEGHTLCPSDLQKGHTNRAPEQGEKGTHHSYTVTQGADATTALSYDGRDGSAGQIDQGPSDDFDLYDYDQPIDFDSYKGGPTWQ